MRITCLSVSDQLGGSEIALAGMISAIERIRPDWRFQVVLPGEGPLRERLSETRATCAIVPMPSALLRLGEWGAVQQGWSASAQVSLGMKLCGTAATLPSYESRLGKAIADFAPDVIHTNGFKAHVLAARAGTNARVVWHLHEYVSRRKLTRWLLRRYAARCSSIIANSKSVAADVVANLGSRADVHVVANSVNLTHFSPVGPRLDLDRLTGLAEAPPDVLRVGLVATYGRWKGHKVFLDALRSVSSARAVRGYIIGGPIYDTSNSQITEADLREMIRSRQLGDRVGLTGFVDAAQAMRALDVVVHASTEPEPFGLVIAEAMACGRAVITTGAGGAAELVSDGQDALIAAAGDPRALAETIERLANDSSLGASLGGQANKAARSRFAPTTIGLELAHLFESVASRSAVAQPV